MRTPISVPTPVTIVGGFLGSGKTTLLNHILTNADGVRLAALVNDFGTINVDAKLIVSVEGDTVSLANGCVCCTIRDDLLIEVEKLLATDNPPEHIVIETSGVSKPLSVAETFTTPSVERLVDVRIISVLDADLVQGEQTQYSDLAIDHIRYADIVVINKTDLVTPAQLARVRQRVQTIAARSRIWETTFGVVPLDLILDGQPSEAMAKVRNRHPAGSGHHEPHQLEFETWTLRSHERWPFDALQRAVEGLPPEIYRAKGIVRLDLETDDYGILQVTGRRATLRLCEPEVSGEEPDTTELVFIGTLEATTDSSIRELFGRALEDARAQVDSAGGYRVKDLRSFNVVFV